MKFKFNLGKMLQDKYYALDIRLFAYDDEYYLEGGEQGIYSSRIMLFEDLNDIDNHSFSKVLLSCIECGVNEMLAHHENGGCLEK